MDFSYSKICEYSDMLKQGGWFINPFFPIYKAIFYGYLHNKIMNRQVQQEDWWGVVQSCCLTGSDISQQKLSLSQTLSMDSWKDLGKILIQLNPPNFFLLYCQKPTILNITWHQEYPGHLVLYVPLPRTELGNTDTGGSFQVKQPERYSDNHGCGGVLGVFPYSSFIFLYENDIVPITRWEVSVKKIVGFFIKTIIRYLTNRIFLLSDN